MHVQGHIKSVLFVAPRIIWHKSVPQPKSKKEWLQKNDAIWVFGSLPPQCNALETRQDCLAVLMLLQLLEIHCEAKELLTPAGTGQHLADCNGKISFDFPKFHGSDVVWEYSHAEMETETRGLLPYVKAQTTGLSWKREEKEWVWGERTLIFTASKLTREAKLKNQIWVLKMPFFFITQTNYSTQEISLWIQQLKFTFWSKQTLKQLYPTPQYFVQQHTLRSFCK